MGIFEDVEELKTQMIAVQNTSTYREFVSLYGMCWVVD